MWGKPADNDTEDESGGISVAPNFEPEAGGEMNLERIQGEILPANIELLQLLRTHGIRVYIIDEDICGTIPEIMESVKSVVTHITKTTRLPPYLNKPRRAKRCLLYKDKMGRFYNLTLPPYTTAPASMFQAYLDSFSGVQAMGILVILCRSFPCASQEDTIIERFQPAFLGVLLGLVFVEEISLSWLNTAMFIRGMPSISAYSITTNFETDWIRKLLVFCLYLGAATEGDARLILTLTGISMTCLVVLANLGARAWGFMGRRPLRFGGPFEPIFAYCAAVAVGLALPYLAYRETQGGRQPAIRGTILHALMVAIIVVASDYNKIQQFLVIGSETCDQHLVNIAVGVWWCFSLIGSLFVIMKLPGATLIPGVDKPLLQGDHASPVGFKIATLPDFSVDPILGSGIGDPYCNVWCELVAGIFLAIAGGAFIVYLAYADSTEFFAENF